MMFMFDSCAFGWRYFAAVFMF